MFLSIVFTLVFASTQRIICINFSCISTLVGWNQEEHLRHVLTKKLEDQGRPGGQRQGAGGFAFDARSQIVASKRPQHQSIIPPTAICRHRAEIRPERFAVLPPGETHLVVACGRFDRGQSRKGISGFPITSALSVFPEIALLDWDSCYG